ncbi:hypothetical protein RND71_015642 [Anisodus tanguticus]|uniref:Zinc finger GRF-type domain-containing protein n=1 Tax=Anisodus tanguticus TaxID=243964 RepID=A0AAE1VKI1_9SOLA|nr:hypothetical protein RND71_015642 [Anisodus tanguticus]
MLAFSFVSSPQQIQSRSFKCGLLARIFIATIPENCGYRFYKYHHPRSNSCGYWDWIDDKLPPHVSVMIHNKKIEMDSIQKEINHLKKLVEVMGGIESQELNKVSINDSELKVMADIEISDLKSVSTLEDKVSNLELKSVIESSNLKKVKILELKVYHLISLLVISWAFIIGSSVMILFVLS